MFTDLALGNALVFFGGILIAFIVLVRALARSGK